MQMIFLAALIGSCTAFTLNNSADHLRYQWAYITAKTPVPSSLVPLTYPEPDAGCPNFICPFWVEVELNFQYMGISNVLPKRIIYNVKAILSFRYTVAATYQCKFCYLYIQFAQFLNSIIHRF